MNLPLWLASPGFVILFRWTCLLAFGWVVHLALRRRHAGWRVILWRGVLCSGLVLPLLHFFPVPGVKIPVRMDAAAPAVPSGPPATEPATDDGASQIQPAKSATLAQPAQSPLEAAPAPSPALRSLKTFAPRASAKPVAWGGILVAIWLSGCAFGVFRLVRLQLQLSYLVKTCQPAADLRGLATQIQRRLNVRREIDVRISEKESSPFVCGLRRPVIILPKTLAQSLLPDELSALVSHEIAHLRQHDLFWCVGWQWMKAVSWFHPLVWKIPAAHNLACEQEADRIAAGQLENEDFYAQMLARLALRVMAWPAGENKLTLNGSSQIARRLNYLGQEGIGAWNWKFSAAGCGIVALMFLITSGSGFSILPASASRAGEGRAPSLVDQRHGSNMANRNRVAAPAQDAFSVSTEDLISKLQDESAQGIGTHETADFRGFMAINEEPKYYGGVYPPVKPVVSPVMRELVRRGVGSLPALIDHLSDGRPTKLIVAYGKARRMAKDYDPRDPKNPPAGFDKLNFDPRGKEQRHFDRYTVKVGDLCFVAVGQIVNRQLNAVRPEGEIIVNSPVEMPELAAAVKADWAGLTPADHERSLEDDARPSGTSGPSLEAVKRLMFYYPEPGVALAVRSLNEPLCDNQLAMDFLENRLLKAKDESNQDRLMAQFRKENGEANYGAMQRWLVYLSTSLPDALFYRAILNRVFPGVDDKHPPKSAGMEFWSMQGLVDALAIYPSEAIDQAVYDLLKRTSETHPTILQSVTERCQLVHACAWRLTKPGERDAFEKSYASIMSSLPKMRQSGKEPQAAKMTAFDKRFQTYLDDEIGKLAPQTL